MIQISGVPPWHARGVWPLAGPWTEDALKQGAQMVTADEVLEAIEEGRIALWLVLEDGVAVASFTTMVEGQGLTWFTLGGHGIERWLPDVDKLLTLLARAMGCRRVQLRGRRGWTRKLAPFGWKETAVTMTKDVCDG